MRFAHLAAVSVILLAASATVWADDAKSLQGTWKPAKAELGGQALPGPALQPITLKINGDKYEVSVGEQGNDKGTCKLDTHSKPKRMSINSTEGANKGKTFPAIYEIKGNTLKVCYDLSGSRYPAEFKTEKGTKLYLVVYERQKH